MAAFTIQFDGICCHIKPPNGTPAGVERRSVLPDVHEHVTYIEMYTTDVDVASNPAFEFTAPYTRDNRSYQHTTVKDVKIELLNITSTKFMALPSFNERIPKLMDVEPRFTAVKPSLLQQTIASGQVAAYFDIQAGVLSSGPSEGFRTLFNPVRKWPKRHLGQWVELEVEVGGNAPMLSVKSLNGGGTRTLVLKEGADLVTIGNQPLRDIHGDRPLPNSNHFPHYYDLAQHRPTGQLPVPKGTQGLGPGCGDTQWP